jgi:hypothetical protein
MGLSMNQILRRSDSKTYSMADRVEQKTLLEGHQSLPVFVFGDGSPVPDDAEVANGRRFISSTDRILEWLAERFKFPHLHD